MLNMTHEDIAVVSKTHVEYSHEDEIDEHFSLDSARLEFISRVSLKSLRIGNTIPRNHISFGGHKKDQASSGTITTHLVTLAASSRRLEATVAATDSILISM